MNEQNKTSRKRSEMTAALKRRIRELEHSVSEHKRMEEERAILAETGRVICCTLEIDEVYERIAAEIGKMISFDILSINLFHAQQATLEIAYISGLDIPGRRVGESYPLRDTVSDEVARTRKGMIVQSENPEDLIEKFPGLTVAVRAGLRSIITIPLIFRDELIGSLVIRSRKSVAYSKHDLHLAESIGAHIAVAIANAQLYSDIKQTGISLRESEVRFRDLAGEMGVIAEIGRLIGSTMEIDEVYDRFAAEARKLIPFASLIVNLKNPQKDVVDVAYASGMDIPGRRKGDSFPLGRSVTELVMRTKAGLVVPSEEIIGKTDRFSTMSTNLQMGLYSFMSVPLIFRDEAIGALVFRAEKRDAYTERELRLAERIGAQIAGAIANAKLFGDLKLAQEGLQETLKSLRKAIGTTIQVMVSAVEARDPYTSGHQIRSANLARAIGVEMGLPQEKIDGIRMAGSIHDIGKLSIPAEILSKPTRLSEIEFYMIKEHSRRGFEILKDVESPWPLAEIVYQHHERMDGSGYPRHLRGEEILIEARILAVADVVEAMASHRPYRPSLGIDAALNEIEKNGGIFYDGTVVDACLRLFREKGYSLEGIDANR